MLKMEKGSCPKCFDRNIDSNDNDSNDCAFGDEIEELFERASANFKEYLGSRLSNSPQVLKVVMFV